ncbi:precorrin-8X methylmutase [Paracoccus halophilus]|uniref:Precorrin-8X methylmutase n=3 Tax=Paracoccus halophilus TaxID=376733 RepID=A0A1I0TB57_9RHOB|nr:precorrin-8X methylmutase [Paracoccus halophilus]
MSGFQIKGWCPGALRPMASGDGLVLRIRARNGRLSVRQAQVIARLSRSLGNGLIDLTSRANLQLRGLDARGHARALTALRGLCLLDDSPEAEARRNVILTPFAPKDGPAWRVASALSALLTGTGAPDLPGKFGFAVDQAQPLLSGAPADIRLIPAGNGWQIWPEGADWFLPATTETAAATAISLAHWFIAQGGVSVARGRMRDLIAHSPPAPGARQGIRPPSGAAPQPGHHPQGWLLGFAFGLITPGQLAALKAPVRLTPWRMLLVEDQVSPGIRGAIRAAGDPLLRIHACAGERCEQGRAPVRRIARDLAPHLGPDRSLHVSGCAKGCAHRGRADLTLIATAPDRFDLIRGGSIRDGIAQRGLGLADLTRLLDGNGHEIGPKTQGMPMHEYETDGARIYAQSFATIRAEADLARFDADEEPVVVRMIHAAGLVGLERDIAFSPGMASTARRALEAGAPILCDARMVSEGITRARLPANNRILCTLNAPGVPELAAGMGTTRSAAAVELWRQYLGGAVVAIGNAPTALFHLLNMLRDPDCPRPAAIIGCPVGFVGAAESKDALMADLPAPSLIVRGRLGGSAITVAAVNALASRKE